MNSPGIFRNLDSSSRWIKSLITDEVPQLPYSAKHCKTCHAPATAELAKQYLAWREKQSAGPAREALRWFYREGRKSMTVTEPGDRKSTAC